MIERKKKYYEEISTEIILIHRKDVLTASGDTSDDFGGMHSGWLKNDNEGND